MAYFQFYSGISERTVPPGLPLHLTSRNGNRRFPRFGVLPRPPRHALTCQRAKGLLGSWVARAEVAAPQDPKKMPRGRTCPALVEASRKGFYLVNPGGRAPVPRGKSLWRRDTSMRASGRGPHVRGRPGNVAGVFGGNVSRGPRGGGFCGGSGRRHPPGGWRGIFRRVFRLQRQVTWPRSGQVRSGQVRAFYSAAESLRPGDRGHSLWPTGCGTGGVGPCWRSAPSRQRVHAGLVMHVRVE